MDDWKLVLDEVRSQGYDPVCFVEIGFDWYDFLVWQRQFLAAGSPPLSQPIAIPEPRAIVLLIVGASPLVAHRRRLGCDRVAIAPAVEVKPAAELVD